GAAPMPAGGVEAAEPLLLLGEVYLGQGLAGEALERLVAARKHLEAVDPAQEEEGEQGRRDIEIRAALSGIARSLLLLERADEAAQSATRLYEMAPDDVDGMRLLARALAGAGQHIRAAA